MKKTAGDNFLEWFNNLDESDKADVIKKIYGKWAMRQIVEGGVYYGPPPEMLKKGGLFCGPAPSGLSSSICSSCGRPL